MSVSFARWHRSHQEQGGGLTPRPADHPIGRDIGGHTRLKLALWQNLLPATGRG
jgi:hypothetical protein